MENNEVGQTYFGTVIWFSGPKGIGFILWEKDGVPQKDMFLHYSDLVMEGYRTVQKDQRVSFQIGTNKNGDPKAINVTVLKHHSVLGNDL